jgi:glycosyltransferase involved in cell wall biosynthesis
MKHRFHVLGLPHTIVHSDWVHCAYTMKLRKFEKMMSRRGHEVIIYSNEGADVPCETVTLFSEAERVSFFGSHEKQKLYHLQWDSRELYWQQFNERCIERLEPRVKKGDFILSAGGNCAQPVADVFPGSYSGVAQTVMFVEPFIGYYGTFSRYRCFESHGHREWMMGAVGNKVGPDFDTAVIPNYWDMDEFPIDAEWPFEDSTEPYYLFIGRVIPDKGYEEAIRVTKDIGASLVIAGQGSPNMELPPHVSFIGHADVEARARLMKHAIAVLVPTRFREPFGGVAVEAQLSGTPAITTDYGAFVETVEPQWRCSTHRELCEAAVRAQTLTATDRMNIRLKAASRYSLEAVGSLFERYFDRLYSLWGDGYYEMRELEKIAL